MAALTRPRVRLLWLGALTAGIAEAVSAILLITLPSAGTSEAGWRHELICSLLAALAVYGATWMQDRPWPQPAALYAALALLLEALTIVLPLERMAALPVLAAAMLAIGVAALVLEWLASRGASIPLRLLVTLGILELMAITPTFAVLLATGFLR